VLIWFTGLKMHNWREIYFLIKHLVSRFSCPLLVVLCHLIVDKCNRNPRRVMKTQHGRQIPWKLYGTLLGKFKRNRISEMHFNATCISTLQCHIRSIAFCNRYSRDWIIFLICTFTCINCLTICPHKPSNSIKTFNQFWTDLCWK